MMKKLVSMLLAVIVLASCSEHNATSEKNIFVTIQPLKLLVDEITTGDFDVKVLVPEGASPETYEPTSQQIAALNSAEFIFKIGLIDFEQSLVSHIDNEEKIVNLSHGITPIEGSCSHHHAGHHHHHGIDPHIWTSPRALKIMVGNIEKSLMAKYPDSTKYAVAAERIVARLDSLDAYCAKRLSQTNTRAIMIYHPAYTYLARDYNIEQISIEHEGKEPTPRQLTELIAKAREMGIKQIFHQPQYSPEKLRSIAEEIDAEIIMCDPLAKDIEHEIRHIIDQIVRDNE